MDFFFFSDWDGKRFGGFGASKWHNLIHIYKDDSNCHTKNKMQDDRCLDRRFKRGITVSRHWWESGLKWYCWRLWKVIRFRIYFQDTVAKNSWCIGCGFWIRERKQQRQIGFLPEKWDKMLILLLTGEASFETIENGGWGEMARILFWNY